MAHSGAMPIDRAARKGTRARQRAEKNLRGLNPAQQQRVATAEVYDIVQACRRYVPEAIKTIMGIMRDADTPSKEKIQCVRTILDRAYGKTPQQTLHVVVGAMDKGQLEDQVRQIMLRRGEDSAVLNAKLPATKGKGTK